MTKGVNNCQRLSHKPTSKCPARYCFAITIYFSSLSLRSLTHNVDQRRQTLLTFQLCSCDLFLL